MEVYVCKCAKVFICICVHTLTTIRFLVTRCTSGPEDSVANCQMACLTSVDTWGHTGYNVLSCISTVHIYPYSPPFSSIVSDIF